MQLSNNIGYALMLWIQSALKKIVLHIEDLVREILYMLVDIVRFKY